MMQMMVPTLNVDPDWHTYQLSPARYYEFSTTLKCSLHSSIVGMASKSDFTKNFQPGFIDHDDKIKGSKLSNTFTKTTELYQKRYKEPYSMCTCWYCESVSAQSSSVVSSAKTAVSSKTWSIFHRKTATHAPGTSDSNTSAAEAITQSIDKQLYSPYKSVTNDPSKGPYISAHNSVRPIIPNRIRTLVEWRLAKQASACANGAAVGCGAVAGNIVENGFRTNGAAYAMDMRVGGGGL